MLQPLVVETFVMDRMRHLGPIAYIIQSLVSRLSRSINSSERVAQNHLDERRYLSLFGASSIFGTNLAANIKTGRRVVVNATKRNGSGT